VPRDGRRTRAEPGWLDAGAVERAVNAVIGDPTYRRRANEVAAEVAAMPGPDAAADRIESIVRAAATGRQDVLSAHD